MHKLYYYPQCSTCVKARRWLESHDIPFTLIHMVNNPPTNNELQVIHSLSQRPLKALFNVSGQSYRKGDFKTRLPTMTDAEKFTALANDGKLIKRPILVNESMALIGFKEAEWTAHFNTN